MLPLGGDRDSQETSRVSVGEQTIGERRLERVTPTSSVLVTFEGNPAFC